MKKIGLTKWNMCVHEEARSAGIRFDFFPDTWAHRTTPLLDTLAQHLKSTVR